MQEITIDDIKKAREFLLKAEKEEERQRIKRAIDNYSGIGDCFENIEKDDRLEEEEKIVLKSVIAKLAEGAVLVLNRNAKEKLSKILQAYNCPEDILNNLLEGNDIR